MTIYSFTGDNRFLSNFYPCKIKLTWWNEVVWVDCVEKGYQAKKSMNRVDFDRICAAKTPGQAKRIGKTIPILPEWDTIKITVMKELLQQKFADPVLAKMLEETESQELIEGNTWGDRFWGVCNGMGLNNLGKLLMEVRNDLFYRRKK